MATLEQNFNLNAQLKKLVAIGASVGAGCQPCVSHYLRAGAKAGLEDEQLLAAVVSAERVTAEAAVLMNDHVRTKLGADLRPALLSPIEETLASVGAALAANDKTNIERALKAALELGVTRVQLHEVIETARGVQENAARIHVREAQRLLEPLEARASQSTDEGCGCGGEEATAGHEPPAASLAGESAVTPAASDTSDSCGGGC
jgi:AhpD family alkylhydroperoxidase